MKRSKEFISNQLQVYRWPDLPRLAAMALLYALLTSLVLSLLTTSQGRVSMVWVPSGLGLAALLTGGKGFWPGIFLGALGGYLISLDRPLLISASIALGSNTLEPLVAIWLLSRASRWGWHFDSSLFRPRDYLLLGLAGTLASGAAALIGCTSLLLGGILAKQGYSEALLHWWMGNLLGLVLVTPLLLVWRQLPRGWFKPERMAETILCFGLAFLSGQIIFLEWHPDIFGNVSKGFFTFVFVAWSATRFGRHGTLLVIAMTSIQALLGAIEGVGYFATDIAESSLINYWLFMLVLTLVGIALALVIGQRREIETELRKSETRFRTMADFLPHKIWTTRPDGSLDYVNQRVIDFFGRPLESMIGGGWLDSVHPDDLPHYTGRWTESLQTGKPFEVDIRLMHRSGKYRWCTSRALAFRDEDGTIVKWYGTNTDITQRKTIEEELRRSEMRYRLLTENMKDVVWVLDTETMYFVYISPSVERLRGFTPEEMMSMPALGPYPPGNREKTARQIHDRVQDFLSGKEKPNTYYTDEFEAPRKDGSSVWVEMISCCQFNEETGHVEIHGVTRDISARKSSEEEMQLASLVYQNCSEGMMVTDEEGNILTINPAFTQLTGYTADEVVGKNPDILDSGLQDHDYYQAMWRAVISTGRWQGELWNRRKNGEVFAVWTTINSTFNEDGTAHRRVALFSDITQKKQSDKLIWRQANFDPLTGLPNRQMFRDRLEQEIKKTHRTGLPLALIFLDLDCFKEVNDTLGHAMGDILLKEAAQRISRCVRQTDTVARLGGDEFTIILGELSDLESIERVARDILQRVAEPFPLGEEVAFVSCSIGITLYPADASDIDTLLKNADQSMYAAKHLGRNRYCYFTPAMQEAAQARMILIKELRGALADNQFRLVYQPIVELATGAIQKAEALIRWQHPKRGLIRPSEFIPIAEETGMLVDIGNWVFREATRQVERWRAAYQPSFQISVNKSPAQFKNTGNTNSVWYDYLKELGLPGQSIVVEITEGLLMDAGSTVADQLLEFRDAGIQVSLDDFGSGRSSLSYLKKFDIDYLKIDQSFVRNLEANSDELALCEAIIVMAHKLGMKVIAEGVETAEQRDLLVKAGCDCGQGYLFSIPLPAEEFEKLL